MEGTRVERDGRILATTHWAALVVFLILVPALVILWGMPHRTADAWAWTIEPNISAIFLGAGYGAGAYFFLRTFFAKQWHPSAAGVFGAAFFAGLMLITTLEHWERFNHGDAPFVGAAVFYGWVGVYIVSPAVVMALWFFNRRADSGEPVPGEAIVPKWVRMIARVVGIGALGGAAVFLLSPDTAIDHWGWQLTPLTARVIGCFTAQVGVGALWLSTDRRWSAWKLIVQTFFVASALLLIGAAREWEELDADRALTWLYLGGLVSGNLALLMLYRAMRRADGKSSSKYHFVTTWCTDAPIQRVFEILHDSEKFPEWWKGVTDVEVLERGDERGVGEVAIYSWRSVLPYTLTFESRVTRIEEPHLIEAEVTGELEGVGIWRLYSGADGSTAAVYEWSVRTTKLWMNMWGPLPRPAFAWNHDRVMQQGGAGLADRLGARLIVHD